MSVVCIVFHFISTNETYTNNVTKNIRTTKFVLSFACEGIYILRIHHVNVLVNNTRIDAS